MSKALSFKEFSQIVNYISEKRSMQNNEVGYPYVKYIDPVFDMRTNTVFSIKFRGAFEKHFHCVNECRDLTESMFERIMTWLNTKKEI